jgi:hypothetical protein
MQNHSQYNQNCNLFQHPQDQYGYRQQQRDVHSSPRSTRIRCRGEGLNVPRSEPRPLMQPRPRQEVSGSSPRKSPSTSPSSPKLSPRKCNSIEGGPKENDVVCYSIVCPKKPRGVVVIQPNSTHEGNLRFGALVRSHAHAYTRAMVDSTSNASEKDQKHIAKSIVCDIHSKGGRFLVWIKQNQNLPEHKNNGSWHLVDREDARNISRYALFKQAEVAMKEAEEDNNEDKPSVEKRESSLIHSEKKPSFNEPEGNKDHSTPNKKMWEIDGSTATNSCSSSTALHILSEISVDSEDSLDIWSLSPCGDKDRKQHQSVRLEECCWEYKLLLPLTME